MSTESREAAPAGAETTDSFTAGLEIEIGATGTSSRVRVDGQELWGVRKATVTIEAGRITTVTLQVLQPEAHGVGLAQRSIHGRFIVEDPAESTILRNMIVAQREGPPPIENSRGELGTLRWITDQDLGPV